MCPRMRVWAIILAVMLGLAIPACGVSLSSDTEVSDTATPPSEFVLGDAQLSVQSVSLRQSYSTYYLMTFSGPEHIFLILETAITGVDDPKDWAETHVSLVGIGEVFPLERIRPILTNEDVEYRADFMFEYVYEFIVTRGG